MNDKIFVDSNIWLYLFDKDLSRKAHVLRLLSEKPTISSQVLSENANVCIKKFKLETEVVERHISNLTSACRVVLVKPSTIEYALKIRQNNMLGFYDSQILAAAIENGCNVLFTEDLNENAVYEGKIKVVNPFRTT